jgi:paraquat-inducible protein B
MKTHASPTLIGVFTLVGLAIATAAVVLLGADKLFKKTYTLQLYFDKSANGLQVGSDVRFGGVRVGSVRSIGVMIDPAENRKIIPVVVSLNASDLGQTGMADRGGIDFSSHEGVAKAVRRGLRAGMKQQSLVTGQLYVEFDVVPEIPGFLFEPKEPSAYPVVPTIGTELDELISGIGEGIRKFNALDLDRVISSLHDLLQTTSERIAEINTEEINRNILSITEDIATITGDERIATAIENLNLTLANLEALSTKANDGIDPLLTDAEKVLAASREVLEGSRESLAKLESAVEDISGISNPRGPVLMRLQQSLHETERAARALKELSNDLKRDPKAIITGKADPE